MNKLPDWMKWILVLGIGALGGLVNIAAESTTAFPGWWTITRHCLIDMGSVIPALYMTLSRSLGIGGGNGGTVPPPPPAPLPPAPGVK